MTTVRYTAALVATLVIFGPYLALAAPVRDEAAARKIAVAALKEHWTAQEYAHIMKGQGLTAKLDNKVWEVASTDGDTAMIWISAETGKVLGIRGQQ